ncbi:hypothetical protein ACTMTI_13410 [Nonomuraea sp. H19]|uniref:hypothetical protein n=1 Tax=Nonomuraea sp. H19 TaxID=3452206 RepID=UPI003F896001
MAVQPLAKPAHVFGRDREWAELVRFATARCLDARLGMASGTRPRPAPTRAGPADIRLMPGAS